MSSSRAFSCARAKRVCWPSRVCILAELSKMIAMFDARSENTGSPKARIKRVSNKSWRKKISGRRSLPSGRQGGEDEIVQVTIRHVERIMDTVLMAEATDL